MTRGGQITATEGERTARAPDKDLIRLDFPDLPHMVELHDADAVRDALATVMPAWIPSVRPGPAPSDRAITTIRHDPDAGYSFRSWWSRRTLTDLGIAGATCGAVADLIQGYLDNRPGLFGLHCGAVRIGGHLVAFSGPYRAGKTTLVTRLGASPGCEVFCDDVLPIEPDGMAVALGVQPRLRLPLPDTLAPAFRDHVARNLTVQDDRYGFVSTRSQAPLGTRAPLAALVVLSRQDSAPARFHHLGTSDAAAFLIRQNIADPGNVEQHYDRIAALTGQMVCLSLVYSDIEEATALLRRTFGTAFIPNLAEMPGPALSLADPENSAGRADLDRTFARHGEVIERVIGSDTFLWQMDGRNFFSLNTVGGAVWTLLETPVCGRDIATTLHAAFPEIPAEAIAEDVARLLGQMQKRGLVFQDDDARTV